MYQYLYVQKLEVYPYLLFPIKINIYIYTIFIPVRKSILNQINNKSLVYKVLYRILKIICS